MKTRHYFIRSMVFCAFCWAVFGCVPGDGAIGNNEQVEDDGGVSDTAPAKTPQGVEIDLEAGVQIGQFELAAPSAATFILHGVLPVPIGLYPREDGQEMFGIALEDGSIVPAQAEVVRWDPNGWAKTIELIALVERPAGALAGDRISYDIITSYYEGLAPPETNDPATLLQQANFLPVPASTFLENAHGVSLSMVDYYDNEYTCRPFVDNAENAKTLRFGYSEVTVLTSCILKAVAGNPTPAEEWSHGPQVRWIVSTLWGINGIQVDFEIHNGFTDRDATSDDDNLGDIFFKSISLNLPNDWQFESLFAGPFLRDGHLVAPIEDTDDAMLPDGTVIDHQAGDMHYMKSRGRLRLRGMLVPSSGGDESARAFLNYDGLGFAAEGVNADGEPLYSWREIPRFLAQDYPVPSLETIGGEPLALGMEQLYEQQKQFFETGVLTAGLGNTYYPNLGPYPAPDGVQYGGGTGGVGMGNPGNGIRELVTARSESYKWLIIQHERNVVRQPEALYNADGTPFRYTDWVTEGTSNHQYFLCSAFHMQPLHADKCFGLDTMPYPHFAEVQAAGAVPAYAVHLSAFDPHDTQHYQRYAQNAYALVEIGNDQLAKTDLELSAQLLMASLRADMDNDGFTAGSVTVAEAMLQVFGSELSAGVPEDLSGLFGNPVGFSTGRAFGWGLSAVAATLGYTPFDETIRRDEIVSYLERVVDTYRAGQSVCSGGLQAKSGSKAYQSIDPSTLPAGEDWDYPLWTDATFEDQYVAVALKGALENAMRGVDEDRVQKIEDMLRRLCNLHVTVLWNDTINAPENYFSPRSVDDPRPYWLGDGPMPGECRPLPATGLPVSHDSWVGYHWNTFALGAMVTDGDPIYYQRAAEMAGLVGDFSSLTDGEIATAALDRLKLSGASELFYRGALLGVLERAANN